MAVKAPAPWLGLTLTSVVNQSVDDWEFLCTLDGPDATVRDAIGTLGDRANLSEAPAGTGAAGGRNLALHNASGRYVAVIDSDDVWPKDHLEQHLEAFAATPSLVLRGTSSAFVDEAGNRLGGGVRVPSRSLHRTLLRRNVFVHSSVMYRRLSAVELGGYNNQVRIVEDLDLWLRLATKGDLANASDKEILYRCHANQISRRHVDAVSRATVRKSRLELAHHIGVSRPVALASHIPWSLGQR